ncbi:metallophosphoesterase [Candidatus Daviesbacteria bacterium]|nr:metallophosphoesterase [Candidatus Daviesbacteria bacterium]
MSENKFKGWYKPDQTPVAISDSERDSLIDQLPNFQIAKGANHQKVMVGPFSILKQRVRQLADIKNISPWEITRQLRPAESEKAETAKYQERIVYVGDVHGGDQKLIDRLGQLVQNPPDYLIFLGDLPGSDEDTELKRRFYNYLTNHSKRLIQQQPDISDGDLLAFLPENPAEPGMTLKNGYLHLLGYQLFLQGLAPDQIDQEIHQQTDEQIAQSIRLVSSFPYYGEWAATLPVSVKEGLLKTLEKNAKKVLEPVQQLMQQGTRAVMISGNWDDLKEGGFGLISQGIDHPFDAREFFQDNGIPFFSSIAVLETTATLQIFLPYLTLERSELVSNEQMEPVKQACQKARDEKKTIILVGHGEPNLRFHNVNMTPERQAVINNFGRYIAEFLPDEVVYGHQHDFLVDASKPADFDWKYVLRVRNGHTELVEDTQDIGKDEHDVVVDFVPLRQLATLKVPKRDRKARKILSPSPHRQPAQLEVK